MPGREFDDCGAKVRLGLAIAGEERLDRLRVREIEAAAAGKQELSRGRRHALIDGDGRAAARQGLGGHEASWTGADDGNMCG